MTIQTFNFEGNPIRDVIINGNPWWVGKDICTALDISDHHQALNSLPDDERGGYTIPTPQGQQEMICISEPGLYRLIFKSRKEEAERFKRWVCHEVLPEIRKTGGYEKKVEEGFGADGTVPVAAYIALLQDKVAMLEAQIKPKPKRAPRIPLTNEDRAEILKLGKEGFSTEEIARTTGRANSTVHTILACNPKMEAK